MHSTAVYALSFPCWFVLQSSFFNFHTSIYALRTSMFVHLPSLYALHSTVLIFIIFPSLFTIQRIVSLIITLFLSIRTTFPATRYPSKAIRIHPSLYALKLTLHTIITLFLAFHNTIVFLGIPYLYLRTPYPALLTPSVSIRTVRFIINHFPTIHHPKHCTPYYYPFPLYSHYIPRNAVVEVGAETRKTLLRSKIKMGWHVCRTDDYETATTMLQMLKVYP